MNVTVSQVGCKCIGEWCHHMCTLWRKHLSRVAAACWVFHTVHICIYAAGNSLRRALQFKKIKYLRERAPWQPRDFFFPTHLCRLRGCKNTKGTRENDLTPPFARITAHHCNILSSIVAVSNSFPRWGFGFFSLLCSSPRGCRAQPMPDTHTDITENHQHERRFLLPICVPGIQHLHLRLGQTSNFTAACDNYSAVLSLHSLLFLAGKDI